MSESYLPPESLSFRANLAKLVSPLRRVRARTPFFHLPAHRIPVLWTLYRGLLRNAPDESIKFRIRLLFRQNRFRTGTERTRAGLTQGFKYLDCFRRARDGDQHCQDVLERYSRLIDVKREKALTTRLLYEEMDWQDRRRNQPIMTGTFIPASFFNVPLPRLKPQPQATSMIILKRKKARQRRHDKRVQLEEDLADLRAEERFEQSLLVNQPRAFQPVFAEDAEEWRQPILDSIQLIRESQTREYERSQTPISSELKQQVFAARREKIRNKTHEKERERRGELTLSARIRQRKAPPAHILAKMTPRQKEMDKVARSLSEVGYVALVKRRLGYKLKDPDAGLELGVEENRELLDKAVEIIRAENQRKQEEEEENSNDLHPT